MQTFQGAAPPYAHSNGNPIPGQNPAGGNRLRRRPRPASRPQSLSEAIDLRGLLLTFRRHIRLFSALALVVFAIAALVTFTAERKFTAISQLMFEPGTERVVRSESVVPSMPAEEAAVDTQVEVLQSREMALRVVQTLGLERDRRFNTRLVEPSPLRKFIDGLSGRSYTPPPPLSTPQGLRQGRDAAAGTVQRSAKIRRSGMTYVVDVAVTTVDPRMSARIANAYATQYVASQVERRVAATSSANQWLVRRLAQLEPELAAKEAAVAAYRQANGLLSASGATIAEQEISTYNQQLATARAEQATEEARLRTARDQLARGSLGDDVGEALDSPVIQGLRGQRATVSSKVADLRQRYGDKHPLLIRSKEELADIDAQIQAEIKRVMSNLEARVQVARGRTDSVAATLGGARGTLAGNNAAAVDLNRLERDAQVARADYESLLARYRETSSQTGILGANAAVASSAKAPIRPSSPNVPLNLILGLALGLAVGAAGVAVAGGMDEGLTTADDVEAKLGVAALGSIPLLSSIAQRRDRNLTPGQHLLARPLSAFAESFRALRTSLLYGRLDNMVKTLAVTSALPGEGKTTTSLCLARSAAQAGMSVVVVDCDLRRRSLNRALGLSPKAGLVEVLTGRASLDEALVEDEGGAKVLPIAGVEGAQDIFAGQTMSGLLKELEARFDLVVLDTPPVLAVADTRLLAMKADAVLFLAQWRRTSSRAVESAIGILEQSGAVVGGVALNQVDLNEQSRYGYGDPGYYYPQVRKYYAG